MKHVPLALLTLVAIGCGHNEFDVSPAQVSRHRALTKPASLPPDHGVKPGMKFKKGDRLPDGSISEGEMKVSSDGR